MQNKDLGIISIILGLIFVLFPVFAGSLTSIIVGLCFVFGGVLLIISGISSLKVSIPIAVLNLIVGIIVLLLGIAFFLNLNAISFIYTFTFYVMGLVFILSGIAGLFAGSQTVSKLASLLIIIFGIVSFIVGGIFHGNDIFSAIFLGVCLLIEGFTLLLSD